MTAPVRRSPLAHRKPASAPDDLLHLSERAFDAKIVLRGTPDILGPALAEVAGVEMPEPTRSTTSDRHRLLWQSPDEFLLLGPKDTELALLDALQAALDGAHVQIVNVSDYHTTLVLAGPKARETLMTLSTLDLHPRGFTVDQVAGTTFGHALGWLVQTADDEAEGGPVFEILVRWSHADYLFCELTHGARAFGMPESKPLSGELMEI
ncbi:MAG: sarcosine oxidase subunit gamma family protein [Minwuia sp.]|nr:sarcosine oxidase subunit gamma family protein [Minwuia sp.]